MTDSVLAPAVAQLIAVVADLIARNEQLTKASVYDQWNFSVPPLCFPIPQTEIATQTEGDVEGEEVEEGSVISVVEEDPWVTSDPWQSDYVGPGFAYVSEVGQQGGQDSGWQPVCANKFVQEKAENQLMLSQAFVEATAHLEEVAAIHRQNEETTSVTNSAPGRPPAAKQKRAKPKKTKTPKQTAHENDDAFLEAAFQEAKARRVWSEASASDINIAGNKALVADSAFQKCGSFKANNGEQFRVKIVESDAPCGVCGVQLAPWTVAAVTASSKEHRCLSSRCIPRYVMKALDAEAMLAMNSERPPGHM